MREHGTTSTALLFALACAAPLPCAARSAAVHNEAAQSAAVHNEAAQSAAVHNEAAQSAASMPILVTMMPGETPSMAVYASTTRAEAARLRQAWAAAHPGAAAGAAQSAPTSGPALQSGQVVSPTIAIGNATAFPTISFSFAAPIAGLAQASFVFVSPNGDATYFAEFIQPAYDVAGTITFAYPSQLSLWAQPGNWTLQSASIIDNQGNMTSYDAAQLAALFPVNSFRVVNDGSVDATPPTLTGGHIVSTNISMAQRLPLLQVSVSGSDRVSGMDLAYVFIQPPGASFYLAQQDFSDFPIASGSISANENLNSIESFTGIPPSGEWAIRGYLICDAAGNCAQSSSSADVQKLFGTTTFHVKQ